MTSAALDSLFDTTTLRCGDTQAVLIDELGGNLGAFRVGGQDLIWFDTQRWERDRYQSGAFVMFPTVCRTPGGRYTFQGQQYTLSKGGVVIENHGLLRDEPVAIVKTDEATASATWEIDPGGGIYEGYPFKSTLTVTWQVQPAALDVSYAFTNRGDGDAPLGFGIHPFWACPDGRGDVTVALNYGKVMPTIDGEHVPDGSVIDAWAVGADLTGGRSLENAAFNTVFAGRKSGPRAAEIRWERRKMALRIEAGDSFTHAITFTPEQYPEFFCLEQLTCCPNAVNLYNDDLAHSGLAVVGPGATVTDTIRYCVESF